MFTRSLTRSLVLALTLLTISIAAFSHNGMEHVIGTVSAVQDTSVTVNTIQHKSVTVMIDPSTKFDQNNAPGTLKDLKVGDRVVIHAKENESGKLIAVTIKWGSGGSTIGTSDLH